MASAEAKLRLVIEAVDSSAPAISTIKAQLDGLKTALGNATKAPTGTTNDPFTNIRATVTKTREEMEQFYNFAAPQFGKVIGKDIPDASRLATQDLAKLYGEMTGLNVELPKVNSHLKNMNDLMALGVFKQIAEDAKRAGEAIAKPLLDGLQRAMQGERVDVDIAGALKINSMFDGAVISGDKLAETMVRVKKTSEEVAVATMFNDVQVSQAIAQMASSGIDAETIMKGAAMSAAQLAQATGTELVPTTKIMTATLHSLRDSLKAAYGDDVTKQVSGLSDVVTAIKFTTGESLDGILQTLKYVGPISNETGQSFTDLATAMALLGRAGIQGSMAGTGLQRIVVQLAKPTKQAQEALEELGLTTENGGNVLFDASGKMKSLAEVQSILAKSMENLNDKDRIRLTQMLVGQHALKAGLVLFSAAPAEYQKLTNVITQQGIAAELSAQQMRSGMGALDQMMENVNVVKKHLGDALLPAAKSLIDIANTLVTWFDSLSPKTKTFIAVMVATVAGVLSLVGTITSFVSSIGMMIVALKAAGIAVGAIAGPVGIVVAAVVGLIAVGTLLYLNWDTIKERATTIWAAVKAAVGSFIDSAVKWFTDLPGNITKGVTDVGTYLTTNIPKLWSAITDWTSNTWKAVSTWFTEMPGKMGERIGFVAGWLSVEIPAKWTAFNEWLGKTLVAITTWFTELPSKILASVTSVATWLSTNVPKAWNFVSSWVGAVWDSFVQWIAELPGKLETSFTSAVEGIKSVAKIIGQAMWDGITSILSNIGSWISNLVTGAINSAKQAFEGLQKGFTAGKTSATVDVALDSGKSFGDTFPHAAGGIFTGPTRIGSHLFGEAGPEALVPLSYGNLDKYGFLGGSGGSNKNVTVNITINGRADRSDLDHLVSQVRRAVAT